MHGRKRKHTGMYENPCSVRTDGREIEDAQVLGIEKDCAQMEQNVRDEAQGNKRRGDGRVTCIPQMLIVMNMRAIRKSSKDGNVGKDYVILRT